MVQLSQKEVLGALGALSQETRLEIFRLLVQTGRGGRSAGSISDALGVAPATLSHHLAALTNAGLITQRRESRSLIYSANYDTMNGVIGFLMENCCGRPAKAAPCCCEPGVTGEGQDLGEPTAA